MKSGAAVSSGSISPDVQLKQRTPVGLSTVEGVGCSHCGVKNLRVGRQGHFYLLAGRRRPVSESFWSAVDGALFW